ncbi:MAG: redoxin family protein [Deltaproteobacteria bacterium]|nr:redoxin family protein [Deltaproteobacteria bacterium]
MSPSFFARVGLAITSPRRALALAADRTHPGRSGTDLFIVIVLALVATQLRGLFAAAWLSVAVQVGLGVRAVIQVLTRALTVELAFLVVGALLLWLAAGKRRDLGRAFDLACVAALPLLFVDLAATLVVRTFELEVPGVVGFALSGGSYAWAGILIALAVRPAREPVSAVPEAPPEVVRRARAAGWGVVGLLAAGAIVQTVWIARHSDSMRPMTQGDSAPAFALPTITSGGTLGAAVSLPDLHGKVIVLDFWATWCGPCLKAMPKLDVLARTHPDVVVLAINLDDAGAASTIWKERGYRIQLLADDGQVSQRYGVSTIPHSVVIDRGGVVRLVARGTTTQLDATVRALLAEQIRAEQIRK